MLQCTICGIPYLPHRHDYLDVCVGCIGNLRAQVIRDPHDEMDNAPAPTSRECLAAYVDSAHQLTPRQVQAMTRLAAVWRRQAQEEETDGWRRQAQEEA